MKTENSIDVPKVVIVGIPLLLMLWGVFFVVLLVSSQSGDIVIYGSVAFALVSIPLYVYLIKQYASQLGVLLPKTDSDTHSTSTDYENRNRNVTRFDLWSAGVTVVLVLGYFIVGQAVFHQKPQRLLLYSPIFLILERVLKRIFNSRTGKNR